MAFFIVIGLVFARNIPRTQFDADIKSQLPDDMPSRLRLDRIEEIFGGTEIIMIGLETDNILNGDTLKRVKDLSKELGKIHGVDRIMSLSETNDIRSVKGALLISPFLKRIPRKKSDFEELKKHIVENDMVYGSLVSKNFDAASIVVFVEKNINDEYIVGEIKKTIEKYPGKEKVEIAGLPYIRSLVSQYMRKDIKTFMPVGILIMLIFLYVCFRELKGVLLPFVVVILSISIAMGSIRLFGWKIQFITIILPVILIAIANDYGIHLIAEYQFELRENPDMDKEKLIKKILKSLGGPVIAAGLTTIAGLLCLATHIIVPAKQLGILASIGIAFALFSSLVFIPAFLAILPKSKPKSKKTGRGSPLEKILKILADTVAEKPKKVIFASTVFVVLASLGIFKIVVDTNPVNYFPKHSPIVRADNFINEKFGGSTTISVLASGDLKDPKIMKDLDTLGKKMESREIVGSVSSISDVMRKMNKVLNNDDPEFDRVPENTRTISEYYLLYSMSGDPEDLEKLIDFNYENALITERVASKSVKAIQDELRVIKNDIEFENSPFKLIGGFGDILAELVTAVVRGQLLSLALSMTVVAVIVGFLFRSMWAGLFSTIPICSAILVLFGLMGYFGIELNIVTVMLTSIMIGVGVDYTIHFLWRYRVYKRMGETSGEAAKKTLTTVGRGIVFNALSVIVGFLALLLSNFLPVQFFGFLVVVSITTCLIAAIVTLPAMCIVFDPKFLR
ncbi:MULTISPECIES: efflux RND transporter permease subunit [Psychrilyobacter]|uniref:efflux RND transporter permease subunit n=1 Tax=Psychrilyobacter TaxID=623282 RepID=UPI0013148100|nr:MULTISPECIES: MMPL family transporter [Psychrilyobacter]MCS5420911.1 MMPL family transporter [Psychrilyobacter sp. S5]NDI78528.1 RND family transporter [Psychrilyobacter piezotolerans]